MFQDFPILLEDNGCGEIGFVFANRQARASL